MKTYRDLVVWQKAITLVTEIYRISKKLPNEELYGLTSQKRRCALSIFCNIAEGYGRNSKNEFIRFLRISRGSLYELQTRLEISLNLKYLSQNIFDNLYESTRELERMISSLIKKQKVNKLKYYVTMSLCHLVH